MARGGSFLAIKASDRIFARPVPDAVSHPSRHQMATISYYARFLVVTYRTTKFEGNGSRTREDIIVSRNPSRDFGSSARTHPRRTNVPHPPRTGAAAANPMICLPCIQIS
jgi:hypothetical protein